MRLSDFLGIFLVGGLGGQKVTGKAEAVLEGLVMSMAEANWSRRHDLVPCWDPSRPVRLGLGECQDFWRQGRMGKELVAEDTCRSFSVVWFRSHGRS